MKSTAVIIVTIILIILGAIVGLTLLFGRGDQSVVKTGATIKGGDGGVYISEDAGVTWKQKSAVGENGSLGSTDINDIVFHPKDAAKIFIATTGNGIFESSATGTGDWKRISDANNVLAPNATVQQIAFDPQEPARFYAAATIGGAGHVFRSDDDGASFKEIYKVSVANIEVYTLAIDPFDTKRIYIGTGQGGVLVSDNRGDSWSAMKWFQSPVRHIYIHPSDPNFIYLTFLGKDLAKVTRTHDRGANWEDLKITPPKGQRLTGVYSLSFHPKDVNTIFISTSAGMFSSPDAGASWKEYKLIIPPSALPVFASMIDPNDPSKIYVAASNQIYKSIDGGATWQMRQLASIKNIRVLVFSPTSPDTLWAGLRK
jgi:photosystem II stability/assembly factor-like uncharacterized protein